MLIDHKALSGGRVKLSWNVVEDAAWYDLWRKNLNDEWNLVAENLNTTSFTDGPLDDGEYTYAIRAFKTSDIFSERTEATVTVVHPDPPVDPAFPSSIGNHFFLQPSANGYAASGNLFDHIRDDNGNPYDPTEFSLVPVERDGLHIQADGDFVLETASDAPIHVFEFTLIDEAGNEAGTSQVTCVRSMVPNESDPGNLLDDAEIPNVSIDGNGTVTITDASGNRMPDLSDFEFGAGSVFTPPLAGTWMISQTFHGNSGTVEVYTAPGSGLAPQMTSLFAQETGASGFDAASSWPWDAQVNIVSIRYDNGDWSYTQTVHWSYDSGNGDERYWGGFDCVFTTWSLDGDSGYVYSFQSDDYYDVTEVSEALDTDSSYRFTSRDTGYYGVSILIGSWNETGIAADYRTTNGSTTHRGNGSYSYAIEGGVVDGTIYENGNAKSRSRVLIDYSLAEGSTEWTETGTYDARENGRFESRSHGSGDYHLADENTTGDVSEGNSYDGTFIESEDSGYEYGNTADGSIDEFGRWAIHENGSESTWNNSSWSDVGNGSTWKTTQGLQEKIDRLDTSFTWDDRFASDLHDESGTDNVLRTVSYDNSWIDGLLVGGSSTVEVESHAADHRSASSDYSVDFGSYVWGGLFERTYSTSGRWEETSRYDYDESYYCTEVFDGTGWYLAEGTSVTTTLDEFDSSDDCRGVWIEARYDETDDVERASGHWEEGVHEYLYSNCTIEGNVADGVWSDTGTENFVEKGNGYSDMTIDEAEYQRDIAGGSVVGTYGTYERQFYDYDFQGTSNLVDSEFGPVWQLVSGSGYNSATETEGNAFDGEGNYTTQEITGENGASVYVAINGTIVESGRLSTGGSGVRETYAVEDGAWELTDVTATFVNEEILANHETSTAHYRAVYSSGTVEGTSEQRDHSFDYSWRAETWIDPEDETKLAGNAVETTNRKSNYSLTARGALSGTNLSDFDVFGPLPVGFTTLPIEGTRTDREESAYIYDRSLTFELDELPDDRYTWKHEEGTLDEAWSRTLETTTSGNGESGPHAFELETETTRTYAASEKSTLSVSDSIYADISGNRRDAWTLTEGNREETYSRRQFWEDTRTAATSFTYANFTAPGTATTTESRETTKDLTVRETFDAQANSWTRTGTGTAGETLENGLDIACENTTDAATLIYGYASYEKTTNGLEYGFDALTWSHASRTDTWSPRSPYTPGGNGLQFTDKIENAAWTTLAGSGTLEGERNWNYTYDAATVRTGIEGFEKIRDLSYDNTTDPNYPDWSYNVITTTLDDYTDTKIDASGYYEETYTGETVYDTATGQMRLISGSGTGSGHTEHNMIVDTVYRYVFEEIWLTLHGSDLTDYGKLVSITALSHTTASDSETFSKTLTVRDGTWQEESSGTRTQTASATWSHSSNLDEHDNYANIRTPYSASADIEYFDIVYN